MDELEARIANMLLNTKVAAPQCEKPLPALPVLGATPPLPLSQRRILLQPGPVPVLKGPERTTSWYEDHINALRSEISKLQQRVQKYKRRESEDHQTIALLAQQNDYYLREIERQDQRRTEMAKCVATVLEEFGRGEWSSSGERCTGAGSDTAIDDLIRMYHDL